MNRYSFTYRWIFRLIFVDLGSATKRHTVRDGTTGVLIAIGPFTWKQQELVAWTNEMRSWWHLYCSFEWPCHCISWEKIMQLGFLDQYQWCDMQHDDDDELYSFICVAHSHISLHEMKQVPHANCQTKMKNWEESSFLCSWIVELKWYNINLSR